MENKYEELTNRIRGDLAEELREVLGQLVDLRQRVTSVEERLPAIIEVVGNPSQPLDIAALPALLSTILVGRGAFAERTVLIERAIEHTRTYLQVLQLARQLEQRTAEANDQEKTLIIELASLLLSWKPHAGREALTEMRQLVAEAARLTGDDSLAWPEREADEELE